MKRRVLATLMVCASLLVGCGGGGGSSATDSSSDTDTGSDAGSDDSDSSSDSEVSILQNDDPESPYVLFHRSGQSMMPEYDAQSHALKGFTLFGPEGDQVSVSLDPVSGLPTELIADDTIFLLSNIRLEAGLADLAIVDTDGETEFFTNIDYAAFAADVGAELPPASASPATAMQRNHQPSLFGNKTPQQVQADLERVRSAGNLAWGIVSCTIGGVLTAGAAVGAAIDPVKVFGITILEASAGATVFVCGNTAVAIWKEKYPDSTRVSTAENTLESAEDLKGLGENLGELWTACLKKFTSKDCMKLIYDTAKFAKSGTVNRLMGSYLRARDGTATLSEFAVYCCSGPTITTVDQPERWRAALVDGIGTPRYLFDFQWGDGERTQILSSLNARVESHAYRSAGTYALTVDVSDQASNSDSSTTPLPGVPDQPPYTVTVLEDVPSLSLAVDGPDALDTGEDGDWSVATGGGIGPYRITVDWGDGQRNGYLASELVPDFTAAHRYDREGDYTIRVSVNDLAMRRNQQSVSLRVVVSNPVDDTGSQPDGEPVIIEPEPEPTVRHACHSSNDAEPSASWLWYRRIFGGGTFVTLEYDGLLCYASNYYYEYQGGALVGYRCENDWENCSADPEGVYPWSDIQSNDDGSTTYYYNDGDSWGVRIPAE